MDEYVYAVVGIKETKSIHNEIISVLELKKICSNRKSAEDYCLRFKKRYNRDLYILELKKIR